MNIYLIKDSENKFHPFTDVDTDKAAKIAVGEENLFVLKRIRNLKFHRKYFSLIRLAFDNQDQYDNEDDFRKVMQMRAGFYHRVITDKGVAFIPNSISFEKMDADEFEKLYEGVFKVLHDLFAFDKADFEAELNQYL